MIFNPAFKQIWSLFRHQRSFPSVHLSRIEWQVSVTLLMSSIAWLEANTFMKAYGIHSLTKPNKYIMREDNKHDECVVNVQLLQYSKGMHVSREILRIGLFSLTYGTTLTSIKFNNYSTQLLNGPRHLFHSFCCTTTRHINYLSPCVYMSPAFIWINMVCILILYCNANTKFHTLCQI